VIDSGSGFEVSKGVVERFAKIGVLSMDSIAT
jgi:hypothetical protein